MKIPKYMGNPLNMVGHPNNTVRALRSALAIDRALQRKAGAPAETIMAFDYLVAFSEREAAKLESGELSSTRNKRSVWNIATRPHKGAHFATSSPELAEPCIMAGCPLGETGTTAMVADRLQRNAILIELNPETVQIAHERIQAKTQLFAAENLT